MAIEMTLERAAKILTLVGYMDASRFEVQGGHLLAIRAKASHVVWRNEAFEVAEKALEMADADGLLDELEAMVAEANP